MKRQVRAIALAALVAAAAWLLTTSLGRSAAPKADPKADVQKLAKEIGEGGKPDARKAADIAKKYGLDDVMHLLKPPRKGGINLLPPKGIELGLGDLAKKGTTKPDAAAKAADIIQAIAEVAKNYKAADGAKDPAAWSKYTEDMQKAAQDLRKAARANDAAKIKIAAGNVQSACVNCHEKFRE